ncbi:MAG: hypothetical protein CMJ83_18925 [Planctomycetes bacterium]|nr:hypothetical protein [Planctomycetota bacterium]
MFRPRRIDKDALVAQVTEPVRRFLVRLLRQEDAVEEVLSETMLVVIEGLRGGARLKKPVSFALSCAWRKAQEWRARQRRHARPLPLPSAVPDPARLAEIREWLETGLGHLGEEDRALLHLRYVEGLGYKEIARVMEMTAGTVGRRLHTARLGLRKTLERLADAPVPPMILALLPVLADGSRAASVAAVAGTTSAAVATGWTLWSVGVVMKKVAVVALVVVGIAMGVVLWPDDASDDAGLPGDGEEVAGAPVADDMEGERGEPAAVGTRRYEEEVAPAGPSLRAITGIVVDGGGQPVPNAALGLVPWTVRRGRQIEGLAAPDRTDATGMFRIVPAAGDLALGLFTRAEGWSPTVVGPLRAGDRDVRIVVRRGITLTGVVRDIDEKPVGGAMVRYRAVVGGVTSVRETHSGTDGVYTLPGVPFEPGVADAEDAAIDVVATGFAPQVRQLCLALGAPLCPGKTSVWRLDVFLVGASSVTGIVTDAESGQAIEGAEVLAWFAPLWHASDDEVADRGRKGRVRWTTSSVTGPDGNYQLEGLVANRKGLESLTYPGQIAQSGGFAVGATGYATRWVSVAAGKASESRRRNLELWPSGVVTGKVVDRHGVPRAGVKVRADIDGRTERRPLPDGVAPWSTTTNSDGAFHMSGLPCLRNVDTEVTLTAFGGQSVQVAVRAGVAAEAPPIVVAPAAEAVAIPGRVTDRTSKPLAGAMVTWRGSDEDHRPVETSWAADADGRFHIPVHALPGVGESGTLLVSAHGYASWTRVMKLPTTRVAPINVVLGPGHFVAGRVLCDAGRPVIGAPVRILTGGKPAAEDPTTERPVSQGTPVARGRSGVDGCFRIEGLPEGPFDVVAGTPRHRAMNPGGTVARMTLGRMDEGAVFGVAADREDVVVHMPPGFGHGCGAVSVRVRDAKSRRIIVTGVTGYLHPTGVRRNAPVGFGLMTGPGRLDFWDVPPGTYTLQVYAPGGYAPFKQGGVVILETPDPQTLDVAMVAGCVIAGRVLIPEGLKVPDQERLTVEPEGAPNQRRFSWVHRRDGWKFRQEGLNPGRYTVHVSFPKRRRLGGRKGGMEMSVPADVPAAARPLVVEALPSKPATGLSIQVRAARKLEVRLCGFFKDLDRQADPEAPNSYPSLWKRASELKVKVVDDAAEVWFEAVYPNHSQADGEDIVYRTWVPEGAWTVVLEDRGKVRSRRRAAAPGGVRIDF